VLRDHLAAKRKAREEARRTGSRVRQSIEERRDRRRKDREERARLLREKIQSGSARYFGLFGGR
jgi:hypothetical protein